MLKGDERMPEDRRNPRLPERLAKLLQDRKLANPNARWWIQTDAKCTNRRVGSLLAPYLFNELNDRDRRRFESHAWSCILCGATIHDTFELRREIQTQGSKP
jgi:hypothetical protein